MIKKVQSLITNKINRSNERSTNVIKNIIAAFGIKGVSIIISLLLVPLTINYINPTQYGIWLTLSSIVAWFSFFDIGFGNGLRNRFAEAKATGNYTKAKAYISTTYICLATVFTAVWILFVFINCFIDWSRILNAPAQMAKELSLVALIVFSFFCMQIALKTINTILIADQKPAKSAFLDMLGNALALIIIFILTKTTTGSLLYLALALGFCPIAIMSVSSFWLYSRDYRIYKPSFQLFKWSVVKDILALGIQFFFIQIVAIIIYQTTNVIIAQVSNPQNVTVYNIVYKYFSVGTMVFTIVATPLWSAYTDAYAKGDINWIRQIVRKITSFWKLLIIATAVMLLISPWIYSYWIGGEIASLIPFPVSIFCAIYVSIFNWSSIYSFFLNGIGKIRLQLYASIILSILYIPLAIVFNHCFGIKGIIGAMCTVSLLGGALMSIQYRKIINKKSSGIWNK
jgi:O-antigen/teichoic acid export membrane protein